MKRFSFFIIALLFASSFLCGAVTLAFDYGYQATSQGLGYNTTQDIPTISATIVATVMYLVAFIFFGIMMYGGVRWMTSRGDESLAQKGKDAITAGMIGLVIVTSSYAISKYILDALISPRDTPNSINPPSGKSVQGIIPDQKDIFKGPATTPQNGCAALGGMCVDDNNRGAGVGATEFNPDYYCCPRVTIDVSPFTGVDLGPNLCGSERNVSGSARCCELRSTRNKPNSTAGETYGNPANYQATTRCYNEAGDYRF